MRRLPSLPRPASNRGLVLAAACTLAMAVAASGCTPLGAAVTAVGIATDTSIAWEVAKHVHGTLTANDPAPCITLDPVTRALNPRCDYTPGQMRPADFARAGLQTCALAVATRDPRLWRALPELIETGPPVERCAGSPLAGLAAADACPDFSQASPPVRDALRTLAETDARAVRHDVMRLLSCPAAREAGLDRALVFWQERGWLRPHVVPFSPLGALHPSAVTGAFSASLEAQGHRAEAALDGYEGVLPSGYEEALRLSDWHALEWWLARVPRLVDTAPPSRGGSYAWVPLQRALTPGWLARPETQDELVRFLLAHGADPRQTIPADGRSVLAWARAAHPPLAALLVAPPATGAALAAARAAAQSRTKE